MAVTVTMAVTGHRYIGHYKNVNFNLTKRKCNWNNYWTERDDSFASESVMAENVEIALPSISVKCVFYL